MFIKIDKERVINTDQLVAMVPVEALPLKARESLWFDFNTQLEPGNTILFMTRHNVLTTSAIAEYISQLVDAADGFVEATDKPQELSLQSQIAILLKNQKEGLTAKEIQTELKLPTDTFNEEVLMVALNELEANNIVLYTVNERGFVYSHVANTTTDVIF